MASNGDALTTYNGRGSELDDRWFLARVSNGVAAGLEENPDSTEQDAG
jgi:hypothetical protein